MSTVNMTIPMFYNIAPFSPGTEAELAKDMIEYRDRTGNDVVLYCLSFHAEGRPALAKTERLIDSYRALKKELDGSGVQLGMLLQSTLGHWPIVGKDHEPWQRTVTLSCDGVRYCPLDPDHRAFLFETVRRAAMEKPVVMMIDDDVTGFKHDAECFCPLHLAEYERRTGRRFSRDELRKIVSDGKDRELVKAFDEMQEDTVIGVAKLVRDAIDSVDSTIPCCACMPGGEPWRVGRTAMAVAAKGQPPVLRICNGLYREMLGDEFGDRVLVTQYLRNMWKDKIPYIIDESDTFPHNLWSKSARSFHAKLAASFFCGLCGGKLWFVNARRGGCPVSRNYTDILAKHRGYYAAIANAVDGAEPAGVFVPACDDPAQKPCWKEYRSGWVTESFAIYGIPFQAVGDYAKNGVWALAGADTVNRRLSEADLKAILSHRVIIDGTAAAALTARGFAELIGVRAEMEDLVFHSEEIDGLQPKLVPSDNVPVLHPLEGARTLSNLVRHDAGGRTVEVMAPGVAIFDNKLGGRVAVTAWHSEVGMYHRRSEHRQRWMGKILDALTGGAFPVRSADSQNTLVLASHAKDDSLLVQIFNLNFDPLEQIALTVAKQVKGVEVLDSYGQWRRLEIFSQENGILHLPIRLEMMEERVFRLM